jgi:hypothetical protein
MRLGRTSVERIPPRIWRALPQLKQSILSFRLSQWARVSSVKNVVPLGPNYPEGFL